MAAESNMKAEGMELPKFSLPDVNDQPLSPTDFPDKSLLLVVFTCNHCPYAVASWPILVELQRKYRARSFQIIAINPNNNPDYPDDAFDKMKPFAEKMGVRFPYLFDADQKVAKEFGAVCTPDPFLFENGRLIYHGRINDNWQDPSAVKEHSLEANIRFAMGLDDEKPEKVFPSMGCSIKWTS